MININIFGGPGVGKSTISSGLFYVMKIANLEVEYNQEYAKELVYGEDNIKIKDQLLVFAMQNHKLVRLHKKVDYVIHDSPLCLGLVYTKEHKYEHKNLDNLILEVFNSYTNINIFLERQECNEYSEKGRFQNLEEAKKIDNQILNMLYDNNLEFYRVPSNESALEEIMKIVYSYEKD